jgi:hypothetical protein
MRRAIPMMMLALGALTSSPTPGKAQYQHCVAGYGCAPATAESYNACFQLALKRGLNVSRGDIRNLNLFILECLSHKIPR